MGVLAIDLVGLPSPFEGGRTRGSSSSSLLKSMSSPSRSLRCEIPEVNIWDSSPGVEGFISNKLSIVTLSYPVSIRYTYPLTASLIHRPLPTIRPFARLLLLLLVHTVMSTDGLAFLQGRTG